MSALNQAMHRWVAFASNLSAFLHAGQADRIVKTRKSRFVIHLHGKLRRFLLVHFRRGYVKSQLHARQGACRQCGTCCNLLITCPMLTTKEQCMVYGKCRPQACRVFPIDQRDINEVAHFGARCGYSFEQRNPVMIEHYQRRL